MNAPGSAHLAVVVKVTEEEVVGLVDGWAASSTCCPRIVLVSFVVSSFGVWVHMLVLPDMA